MTTYSGKDFWDKHSTTWPLAPLKAVGRLGTGHTPSRSHPEYWEDCTIPWVTTADLTARTDGGLQPLMDTEQKVSELGLQNSAAVLHPTNTVMLSRTASVGHSVRIGRPMATTQAFVTWTCGPLLDPRYLLFVLNAMKPEFDRIAYGSTHLTIYFPDVEQLRVPVPPLAEQRAIVDYLSTEVARVDALIRVRQRMIELLDERELAIVAAPFAGELDYARDGRPIGIVGRKCVRLGLLVSIHTGLTLDEGRQVQVDGVTLPYLRVANVQNGSLNLEELKLVTVPVALAARTALKRGDVLMTEGGDPDKLGRGAVWPGRVTPCLHQNHVFALRVGDSLLPDYLALVTRCAYARAYFEMTASKTTGIASTSTAKIASFRIPIASIAEQRDVVQQVAQELADVERLRSPVVAQIDLLRERRQALITAVVTGELDISGVAA